MRKRERQMVLNGGGEKKKINYAQKMELSSHNYGIVPKLQTTVTG